MTLIDLTDDELGAALGAALHTETGAPDPARILARVHVTARARHRRRSLAAAGSGLLAVAVVALGVRLAVVSPEGPAPTTHPAAPTGTATAGTGLGFTPGEYGGVIAPGLPPQLRVSGPVAEVPLLPAAVRWGADAAELQQLSRELYAVRPDGSVPADNPALLDGRNVRWVAFPFPAVALLQPGDVGAARLYLDPRSVQSTGIRVQDDSSCVGSNQPDESQAWAQDRVAGVSLTLSSGPTAATSATRVVETVGAFDGAGAASALASAGATVGCTDSTADRFTPVPVSGPAGAQTVAGVAVVPGRGSDATTIRFLGVARVGAVVVGVDYFTTTMTKDEVVRTGSRLLRRAVTRLQAPPVAGLVERYVR